MINQDYPILDQFLHFLHKYRIQYNYRHQICTAKLAPGPVRSTSNKLCLAERPHLATTYDSQPQIHKWWCV